MSPQGDTGKAQLSVRTEPPCSNSRPWALSNQLHYFTRVRVPSHLILGEDQFSVYRDLEYSDRGFDQAHLSTGVVSLNLGRQTGGPGFIVSGNAILNADLHVSLRVG